MKAAMKILGRAVMKGHLIAAAGDGELDVSRLRTQQRSGQTDDGAAGVGAPPTSRLCPTPSQ